jgi:hypothetical protein
MYCRSIFEYSRPLRTHFSPSVSFLLRPSTFNFQPFLLSPLFPPLARAFLLSPFVTNSCVRKGRGVPQLWLTKSSASRASGPLLTPCVFNTYRHRAANHLYIQHLRVPRGWGGPPIVPPQIPAPLLPSQDESSEHFSCSQFLSCGIYFSSHHALAVAFALSVCDFRTSQACVAASVYPRGAPNT